MLQTAQLWNPRSRSMLRVYASIRFAFKFKFKFKTERLVSLSPLLLVLVRRLLLQGGPVLVRRRRLLLLMLLLRRLRLLQQLLVLPERRCVDRVAVRRRHSGHRLGDARLRCAVEGSSMRRAGEDPHGRCWVRRTEAAGASRAWQLLRRQTCRGHSFEPAEASIRETLLPRHDLQKLGCHRRDSCDRIDRHNLRHILIVVLQLAGQAMGRASSQSNELLSLWSSSSSSTRRR